MNVLVITQNYPPSKGGMAESCGRIVRNLKKNNLTVHMLHFSNRTEHYILKKETNGYYVAIPIEESEEFTLNLASLFLEKNAALLKFDAILAFGGYLPLMWAPILSKFSGKPLYTAIRGNDFDEALYSKRRFFLFQALEQSEGILSVTEEKQNKIQKLFPHQKVEYTPNGIDAKFWKIAASEAGKVNQLKEKANEKKIVMIAGQLKSKKGLSIFMKSWVHFPHKDEYILWLIGDISTSLKEEIADFEITVSYFTFVDKFEMRFFYHAADIVCIPSLYDGMPNVLLEAAACKKLVIASNVGGIPNVISHEKSGFLYNPLERNALLQNLMEIHILSQLKKEEIANNLHAKVLRDFTEETEINNYLKIFKQ